MARVVEECPVKAPLDGLGMPQPYPVPPNSLPAQEQRKGPVKRPSGPVPCTA